MIIRKDILIESKYKLNGTITYVDLIEVVLNGNWINENKN